LPLGSGTRADDALASTHILSVHQLFGIALTWQAPRAPLQTVFIPLAVQSTSFCARLSGFVIQS
jgi:hypothetical protein